MIATADAPIRIYTDGACRGNPGDGGWGVVIEHGNDRTEANGAAPDTTNNRMELTAAIEALERMHPGARVRLTTDSAYVRKGITVWVRTWKQNAWRTSRGTAVKNRDLWQRLDAAASRCTVQWQWVKGHSGHPGNTRADKLARDGLLGRIIGRSGEPDTEAPPAVGRPPPPDAIRVYLACEWTARRGRGGARHGRGAWAAIVDDNGAETTLGALDDDTTKQRLELTSTVHALAHIEPGRSVEIHTFSHYLEDGITQWLHIWKSQNWHRGAGGRIKNHDLWSALATETERLDVHWRWHRAEGTGAGCGRAAVLAHATLHDPPVP